MLQQSNNEATKALVFSIRRLPDGLTLVQIISAEALC
jgi:hypothetical protein